WRKRNLARFPVPESRGTEPGERGLLAFSHPRVARLQRLLSRDPFLGRRLSFRPLDPGSSSNPRPSHPVDLLPFPDGGRPDVSLLSVALFASRDRFPCLFLPPAPAPPGPFRGPRPSHRDPLPFSTPPLPFDFRMGGRKPHRR